MKKIYICILTMLLSACGFHPQGAMQLAPPLHNMYLQTPDPYGTLARSLQLYLKMSHVHLTSTPATASAILVILQDANSQEMLSVSSTLQTRQYTLRVTVIFAINDASGRTIVPPLTLTESRTITTQSNQILGSSNEANLYYQQMRRSLARAIMNRLTSQEVTRMVMNSLGNRCSPVLPSSRQAPPKPFSPPGYPGKEPPQAILP